MNTDDLKRFVELSEKKSDLGDDLKAVTTEMDEIEERLKDAFQEESIQSVRIDGHTVYLRRELWAGAPKNDAGDTDTERACEALRRAGVGHFVKEGFNSMTVSAWVREFDQDPITKMPILPPELGDDLRVTERYGVRTRRTR